MIESSDCDADYLELQRTIHGIIRVSNS